MRKLLFVVVSGLFFSPSPHAQEGEASQVTVQARKKHGELGYRFFQRGYKQLQSYQPPEPRSLDLWLQAIYTEMTEPERDTYLPSGWGVAILSKSVDATIPVRRGGYFVLPDLPQADEEDAVIMFKEPSRKRKLNVVWALRVPQEQRLGYGMLKKAMAELRAVQDKIPFFSLPLFHEKRAKYDGIKACFLTPGGSVLIAGTPVGDATIGNCTVLKVDPGYRSDHDTIEFSGPLDIVTIVQTADYQLHH